MPSTSTPFPSRVPEASPVLSAAVGVLTRFLHCDAAEALDLLQQQAHMAHVAVTEVAANVVEGDSRQRQWLWGYPSRTARPFTERCA